MEEVMEEEEKVLTPEQIAAELRARKWRGRDDWRLEQSSIGVTRLVSWRLIENPLVTYHDVIHIEDARAIVQGWQAQQESENWQVAFREVTQTALDLSTDLTKAQDELAERTAQVAALKEMLEHTTLANKQAIEMFACFYDEQVGTPCEQIRHQHEIETLTTDRDKQYAAFLDEIDRYRTAVGTLTEARDRFRECYQAEVLKVQLQLLPEIERLKAIIPVDQNHPDCVVLLRSGLDALDFYINELRAEITRLKEGRFTPEEFQNLCHGFSEDDREAFCRGCEEYQAKLFGPRDVQVGPGPDNYGEGWFGERPDPPVEQPDRVDPNTFVGDVRNYDESAPDYPVERDKAQQPDLGTVAQGTHLTVEQCAAQFELYAKSHPSPDSQHSLRFCANFLREFCKRATVEGEQPDLDAIEARVDQARTRFVVNKAELIVDVITLLAEVRRLRAERTGAAEGTHDAFNAIAEGKRAWEGNEAARRKRLEEKSR